MPAPSIERYFPLMTPKERLARRIDDHYHLGMIAKDSRMIMEYSAQAFRMQHDAAIANLRGMGEIASRQDQTNNLLGQTNNLLTSLVGGMDHLNETAEEILSSVNYQTSVLQDGFGQVAQAMLQQQTVLEKISSVLSHPYEARVLELLQEADRALKQGMRTSGRDQKAEFSDAARLLKGVLDNPIGSRNYVAWFQLGWLAWKDDKNYSVAEEAFYQASRLSASTADLYHANGLSHLAYMQYFQNNFSAAYETIHKALKASPSDHDIRYDTARYAATLGLETEAISLIEKCIEQQPQTIVMMFSEEDFSKINKALGALLIRKTDEGRKLAQRKVDLWRDAIVVVEASARQAECEIALPSSLTAPMAEAAKEALTASYVAAVGLAKNASEARAEIIKVARQALEQELKNRESHRDSAWESNQKATTRLFNALHVAEEQANEFKETVASDLAVWFGAKPTTGQYVAGAVLEFIILVIFTAVLAGLKNSKFDLGIMLLYYVWMFGGWWLTSKTLATISYIDKRRDAENKASFLRKQYLEFPSTPSGMALVQAVTKASEHLNKAKAALSDLPQLS